MGEPINVPGYGPVKFPDNYTDAQIGSAIRVLTNQAPTIDSEIDDWRKYAPPRPMMDRAEDVLTRGVSSASFGLAEKAKAKVHATLGDGTYDENLAKYRGQVEEAGKNLGSTGALTSDVVGGLLTGSTLARAGVTMVGRLPAAAPLLTKMGIGGLEGSAYGAAHGAGHTDTGKLEDYAKNILEGAKGGAVVGMAAPAVAQTVQRAITPFAAANPAHADMAGILDRFGVGTTAGQRTGNATLRMMEDTMAKLPLGRMIGGNPGANQMEQVTRAAMQRSGITPGPGVTATPDVLAAAHQNLGTAIGGIQARYPVAIDPPLVNSVAQIMQDLPLLQPGQQGTVRHFLTRLTGGANGAPMLTPEEAQVTRTQLNRMIRAQNGMNGDKNYQETLISVKNALDGALERTIHAGNQPGDVQALQQLRQQYANLTSLTDAIASSQAAGAHGVLTPTALSAATARSVGKGNAAQGVGDLNELGRASSGLLRSPPDSGTATRDSIWDPIKVLASPAAALINRPWAQRYWGNQVMPHGPSPPAAYPSVIGAGTAGEDQFERARRGLLGE